MVEYHSFHPKVWKDTDGVHINAHGGGILYYNGQYYWFGEHKVAGEKGNKAYVGVSCYSSKDLYNWKNEGIALSVVKDSSHPLAEGCIIERPKVIYNPKTRQFVMWFHHEPKNKGYAGALSGIAAADTPTGPYRYIQVSFQSRRLADECAGLSQAARQSRSSTDPLSRWQSA
jgi:hypothetical protein